MADEKACCGDREKAPAPQKFTVGWMEEIIQEAMRRGDSDNLPGKGKPLDLDRDDGADPRTAAMQEALKRLAVAAGGRLRVQARGGREGQAEAAGYGVQQVPALAARYGVRAVPQTVIDGKSQVILVGAQPVGRWLAELMRACQSP